MASRRKKFNTNGAVQGEVFAHAEFIAALLAGIITATRLYDGPAQHNANGKPDFEYDDPNG